MTKIKELLDEAIEKEIEDLDYLETDEEKSQAIKHLAMLHKLRMEEIAAETEAEDKRERRDIDSKKNEAERVHEEASLKRQVKDNMIDRCVKVVIGVVEIMVPLAFYGSWMKQGFEFEKTGSFTSTTFKNLINRFRPTK